MSVSPLETAASLQARSVAARRDAEARAIEVRTAVMRTVQQMLPPGAKAWLIGSLAWGTFGTRSDVDLVIDGPDRRLAVEIEQAVSRLANAPVDLLNFSELPESFQRRILHEGVALHG